MPKPERREITPKPAQWEFFCELFSINQEEMDTLTKDEWLAHMDVLEEKYQGLCKDLTVPYDLMTMRSFVGKRVGTKTNKEIPAYLDYID